MNATDSRVKSAQALLTGPRLLAGHGSGLIRVDGVARLLGVSIWSRGLLVAWIEAQGLWFMPPTSGPLANNPNSGCIDLDALREALQQALASPAGLPFPHTLEAHQ
jgi:hypothetical protein